jgi:hypothetical protein
MPEVNGKKFPYTRQGIAAAAKYKASRKPRNSKPSYNVLNPKDKHYKKASPSKPESQYTPRKLANTRLNDPIFRKLENTRLNDPKRLTRAQQLFRALKPPRDPKQWGPEASFDPALRGLADRRRLSKAPTGDGSVSRGLRWPEGDLVTRRRKKRTAPKGF